MKKKKIDFTTFAKRLCESVFALGQMLIIGDMFESLPAKDYPLWVKIIAFNIHCMYFLGGWAILFSLMRDKDKK